MIIKIVPLRLLCLSQWHCLCLVTNPSPQTPHDATDSHTIILALSVGHGHHLFWVNGVRRLNLSRSLSQIWSPVWNRSYWNRNPSVDWIWMLNYIKLNHTSLQHASKLSLMSSYKVTHFLKTSCMRLWSILSVLSSTGVFVAVAIWVKSIDFYFMPKIMFHEDIL